jgi:hypothetical protein
MIGYYIGQFDPIVHLIHNLKSLMKGIIGLDDVYCLTKSDRHQ